MSGVSFVPSVVSCHAQTFTETTTPCTILNSKLSYESIVNYTLQKVDLANKNRTFQFSKIGIRITNIRVPDESRRYGPIGIKVYNNTGTNTT
jgi:hypothetical protein